jgi:hypothetical protein
MSDPESEPSLADILTGNTGESDPSPRPDTDHVGTDHTEAVSPVAEAQYRSALHSRWLMRHSHDMAAIPLGAKAEPDPKRRRQWLSSLTGVIGMARARIIGNVVHFGPSSHLRVEKKSLWALGGAAAIIAAATVSAATLSGGGPVRVANAASSPVAISSGFAFQARPSLKDSRTPLKPFRKRSSHSSHSSPPAAAPAWVSAGNSPTRQPATAAAQTGPSAPSPSASVPTPVSWWPLNDDKGTTAEDTEGVNPAAGENIIWCTTGGGNCTRFNGSDSQFQTAGPVLDTAPGNSFTVAASVFMTAVPPDEGSETIVSQDGAYDSGFYLQYSGIDDRWAFSMVTADSDNDPNGIRALSTSPPVLDAWTHLVGVYDAPDHQLRLYVNGVLQNTVTDSSPFAATGVLAIGRALFDGHDTDWFNGAANQIEVWSNALTTSQAEKYPF